MKCDVVAICEKMNQEQRARRAALSECVKALGGACQSCAFRDATGCEGRRCSVWRIQQAIDKLRRRWSRKCKNPARWLDCWTLDEIAAVMAANGEEAKR